MTESDLVPVFDGHNDTLLRLHQSTVEKSKRSAVPPAPSDTEPLPPEIPRADALASTIAMASILFRLERASALTVCRSAGDVRNAMAQGSIAAVFHIEGVEAIDP
ncbi:MAG: peptidase, partial [Mesorhizobium sp.]